MQQTTFASLGIPFPLFDAPIEDASDYRGVDSCSVCHNHHQHCFTLDIGCALMISCPRCTTINGLDAGDRESTACRQCKFIIPFPPSPGDEIRVCYACLRAGKAALTKDTELGMISWDQAFEGITHGSPGLKRTDFELVPGEGGWVAAKLSQDMMFELLRTPDYINIQGDRWQFCCSRPMVFVGQWNRDDFVRHAPDHDGHRFFQQIVQHIVPGLWEDKLHDDTGIYVFRCPNCQRKTAHWDLA